MRNLIIVWAIVALGIFTYLARTRPRDGDARDDARRASTAVLWSVLWPLTAAAYALGLLYRLIAEIGR